MVKHAQTILRQLPTNSLSVFDHFVGLTLTGLISIKAAKMSQASVTNLHELCQMCRYYNVIFTFYGLQEVNTATLAGKKKRANITNISFYSRVVVFLALKLIALLKFHLTMHVFQRIFIVDDLLSNRKNPFLKTIYNRIYL